MSEIRAVFEQGAWRDFSKEHALLRDKAQKAINGYKNAHFQDPLAVWGAYGAGKTQFLFWIAETAVRAGLIPVYLHLNDLLDSLPADSSPDTFSKHASAFVMRIVQAMKDGRNEESLLGIFRDRNLLQFIKTNLDPSAGKIVILIDEVEQAYLSLKDRVRADDRSPLKAWLEEDTFKVFAFAVGSLYVLGKADRERLRINAIPAVSPACAKKLFPDLDGRVLNSLWWLSRGKPRHLLKAASRYRESIPKSVTEIYTYVSALDSVSQAPYEGNSQSAVPAVYSDLLSQEEMSNLFRLGPARGSGDGLLFPISPEMEDAFLSVVRDAFKMENVAYDLVRYVTLLADAVSAEGFFALTEQDTPYLLRLAVDFLLEYERERIEKETAEGDAALRKLLEVHDIANQKAGEIFWKFQGKFNSLEKSSPIIGFASLFGAFPLPTTTPSLPGTDPKAVRSKYEELRQPVFEWTDALGNAVFFLTSSKSLELVSTSEAFRRRALAPSGGVIVLLPNDSEQSKPEGFLACLQEQNRLTVCRLPVALSDFLLSLRQLSTEGADPLAIASQAEQDKVLRRQVTFYRTRLESYMADISRKPPPLITSGVPKTFAQFVNRVADKDILALTTCQAFETVSPRVAGFLCDLREFVLNTRSVFQRTGYIAVADDALPHKDVRTGRVERAKLIDDVRIAFSDRTDFLRGLAMFVSQEEIVFLSNDPAAIVALRAIWRVKRLGHELPDDDMASMSTRLTELISVLRKAKDLETESISLRVQLDFGNCGEWIEALPVLERVLANTKALLQSQLSSETKLARELYQAFLSRFIEETASEAASVKSDVAMIRELLSDVTRRRAILNDSWSNECAVFSGISKDAADGLLDEALKQALLSSSGRLTLTDMSRGAKEYLASYELLEIALNRLAAAYDSLVTTIAAREEGQDAD